LDHARGSLYEVQTQLRIAEQLGFLSTAQSQNLYANAAKAGRLLNGLIRKIRSNAA